MPNIRSAESERDSLGRRLGVRFDETERLRHRVSALEAVLIDRERELLEVKGPCSSSRCRLHYAHSGPCDMVEKR